MNNLLFRDSAHSGTVYQYNCLFVQHDLTLYDLPRFVQHIILDYGLLLSCLAS